MNTLERTTPLSRRLGLPMSTIFSVRKCSGRIIAHALDFDLVATAATRPEALGKLRAAVKHHIEFGFRKNLTAEEILLRAPQEYWDKIKDAPLTIGEEIQIENQRIQTFTRTAIDENQPSFATA